MKPQFIFILLQFLFTSNSVPNYTKVKITLADLSDIETLVKLGIRADGYIIEDDYWITTLSNQEIILLETTRFNYTKIEDNSSTELESYIPYLTDEIKTIFNNCGYQLGVSYNQTKKLSFINIQIFDLEGNSYDSRFGYNVPPNFYDCKFNSHDWPDGIYLVKIGVHQKEVIQKVIQKSYLTKRI